MAKPSTDDKDEADRDEAEEAEGEPSSPDEAGPSEEETEAEAEKRPGSDSEEGAAKEEGDEEEEEEHAAAQLGIQRYVLASFFTAAILAAYIFGKMLHGLWSWVSNKDWFHSALPTLAAVSDDDKSTYATIVGAVISLVLLVRTYRKPSVRTWADEVANELLKVKWPTRKEVSNSTVVVIAASAVATIYLALLDRLWSFVTDLFYGTGS